MAAGVSISDALNWGRGICQPFSDTPYLDAQLLLSNVMDSPRAWLLAHSEERIASDVEATFRRDVERYRRGEALPYILGWWEFYGRCFQVNPQVLIPRPETELLVELALQHLSGLESPARVLDVGTGSGCIAVSLAAECASSILFAVDISLSALRLAQKNAREHAVSDRVHTIQADLTAPLLGQFDLICANLPYVPSSRLADLPVGRREPHLALDGGPGGLNTIRRLLAAAPELTRPGGRVLMEIDAGQGERVRAFVRRGEHWTLAEIHQDLAGRDRLVELEVGDQTT